MGLKSALEDMYKFIALDKTTDKVLAIQKAIDPQSQFTEHDGFWDETTDDAWKNWVSSNKAQLQSLGATTGLDGVSAKDLVKNISSLKGTSSLDRVHDLVTTKIESQGVGLIDRIASGISSLSSVFDDEPEETSSSEADIIAATYPNSAHFAEKIVSVANNLGANPYDLANLINFESAGTFSASIQNRLGYTGLIQFGRGAAKDLNTSTADLANMEEEDQMDYVQRYFELSHKRRNADYSDPAALHMAVFYPASINKNTGQVNLDFEFPPKVVKANNGIRSPRDYMARLERNAKIRPDQQLSEEKIRNIIRESILKKIKG